MQCNEPRIHGRPYKKHHSQEGLDARLLAALFRVIHRFLASAKQGAYAGRLPAAADKKMAATNAASGQVERSNIRAMVLTSPKTPLELQRVAVPQPGPNQLRVKVTACGVCRTDLHLVRCCSPAWHFLEGFVNFLAKHTPMHCWAGTTNAVWNTLTCRGSKLCRSKNTAACILRKATDLKILSWKKMNL